MELVYYVVQLGAVDLFTKNAKSVIEDGGGGAGAGILRGNLRAGNLDCQDLVEVYVANTAVRVDVASLHNFLNTDVFVDSPLKDAGIVEDVIVVLCAEGVPHNLMINAIEFVYRGIVDVQGLVFGTEFCEEGGGGEVDQEVRGVFTLGTGLNLIFGVIGVVCVVGTPIFEETKLIVLGNILGESFNEKCLTDKARV